MDENLRSTYPAKVDITPLLEAIREQDKERAAAALAKVNEARTYAADIERQRSKLRANVLKLFGGDSID